VRRSWGIRLVAVIVTVSALLAPSSGAAQTDVGLSFPDDSALTLSWSQLAAGQTLVLCNGGDAAARPLMYTTAGFMFTHQQAGKVKSVPDQNVLALSHPAGIPAGACDTLRLQAVAGAKVDPGTYTGDLALVATGVGVARLAVTISVPPTPVATESVDEISLRGRNRTPWGLPHLQDDGTLLLDPPQAGQTVTIGSQCHEPKPGKPWDPTTCPFLGNLYQGQNVIHVYVAGAAHKGTDVYRLPIRIDAAAHTVGDYEGTLDLTGSGDPTKGVKAKLTVSDGWWCAVVALILGALLSLGLQVASGRWRPKAAFNDRANKLEGRYTGDDNHPLHPPNYKEIKADLDAVRNYAADVSTAISSYGKSSYLFDTTSDAYKQIDASLTLAENDAHLLGAADGLEASLDALKSEVGTTRTLLGEQAHDKPNLLSMAEAQLTPADLGVGDATQRGKSADDLVGLLKTWRSLAQRVLGKEKLLAALGEKATAETGGMDAEDKNTFIRAAIGLREVLGQLSQAQTDDDLQRLKASTAIDSTLARLSYLSSKYDVAPHPDKEPDAYEVDPAKLGEAGGAFLYLIQAGDNRADAQAAPWRIKPKSASAAKLTTTKLWVVTLDIAALLVSVAVAVVAGLSAFFFGKTFGTFEDYLTVIVVGTAGQVVAKAVLDQLSVFWHDVAPESSLQPATATIAPAPLPAPAAQAPA
jgi:hypothetical protein